MEKKAAISVVVALTAFLASTVVLVSFFGIVLPSLKESTDKEICQLSVFAKYASSKAAMGETNVDLKCYTQSLEIREDGIYKSGSERKPKLIKSFSADECGHLVASSAGVFDDDNKLCLVKEAIANEMYDCWDQFYQGKLQVFYESEKRCLVCADIVFMPGWLQGKEASMLKGGQLLLIGNFINDHNIPGNPDVTYSTYLGGRFDPEFSVDTTQRTQVLFTGFEKSWWKDIVSGIACCAVMVGAGVTVGPLGIVAAGTLGCTSCAIKAYQQATENPKTSSGTVSSESNADYMATMVITPSSSIGGSCDRLY